MPTYCGPVKFLHLGSQLDAWDDASYVKSRGAKPNEFTRLMESRRRSASIYAQHKAYEESERMGSIVAQTFNEFWFSEKISIS